jgi:squalene synthase HpnC
MPWDFAQELAQFGPTSARPILSVSEARAYCARVTRSHYENFTVASWLLPRRLVPHFEAIYAYCRWADDLSDETGPDATQHLHWWRTELGAMYAGQVWHPVFIALRETITTFAIPITPFENLLTAFDQDQRVKEYDTFDELLAYCQNSANPVGQLVLHLFGCADEARIKLSDDICTGLQLANFWQDLARDAAIGRTYMPREDRDRFGVTDGDWKGQKFTPEFRELMVFQVIRTHEFFHRGEPLLGMLPRETRVDVTLFLRGGQAVLAAIEKQNYNVWAVRPKVSKTKKLQILMWAIITK